MMGRAVDSDTSALSVRAKWWCASPSSLPSTAVHLVAPRSAGLFSAAGMESGPFTEWIALPMATSEQRFQMFLGFAGCNASATAQVLQCLQVRGVYE
jgi:hypothetical protein